ncbi:MAG: UDP-N-acetylmuramoyl-L-alanyl-D-glutamate--2,6-diaminopimelate ligase [Planctomycetota bacterium]|nr:MAG: UDP-N-acetylmuramoyl-L-alanyl-D-glutamate--2,6-diaminopimelate ligase [Planctomycetota bacterium]
MAGLSSQRVPRLPVQGVCGDSRRVRAGDVFVAVRGTRVDGARYAAEAVARGAVAVVAERPLAGLGVPCLVVQDAASALGHLCDRLRGRPSAAVRVTGVTGTNGKTTTSFLLAALFESAGQRCGLLGTVVNRVGGRPRPARMTTPDAPELHEALAAARSAGERDLVMEVSSHALDQRRVAGVRFRCGVFTNLTRDHLDYHGSLERYLDAKARLFELLPADGVAVLNARDPASEVLAARTTAHVLRYDPGGARLPAKADVAARVLAEDLSGTELDLRLGSRRRRLRLPLVGRFNVENALAAATAAWALGCDGEEVLAGLRRAPGVPGRLERVPAPAGPTVLVDYAHTPDALGRVAETLRPLVPAGGRLIVVFGCGGDRDRGKRPLMGAAAEAAADLCVVTSDNPRSEEPEAIIAEILAGLRAPKRARVHPDRREAIGAAIAAARPSDLVLIAGKGHEREQIVAGTALPFDDREVAAAALRERARRAA